MSLNGELVHALKRQNITSPTEVQEKSIPLAITGKDMIVRSKTGSGKTLAFLLPIMNRAYSGDDSTTLILAPTRELALQISGVANKIRATDYWTATVYGGASMNVQMNELSRNPQMIIGTPGRVIDMMKRHSIHPDSINTIVIDEADTMLDMGFIEDVEYILSEAQNKKQIMLFSATMPDRVLKIARNYMTDPKTLKVGNEEEVTVHEIKHTFFIADGSRKLEALLAYINTQNPKKAIVFLRTKHEADLIYHFLHKKGHDVMLMHGGLTQAKRENSLHHFRKGVRFLIATNVAARGIDVNDITDIINFDIPDDPLLYVHRVGRSARMGKEGRAFNLVGNKQKSMVSEIEYIAKIKMHPIQLDTFKYRDEVAKFFAEERERRNSGEPREGERRGGFRPHGGGFHDRRGGGGGRFGDRRGGRPEHGDRGGSREGGSAGGRSRYGDERSGEGGRERRPFRKRSYH